MQSSELLADVQLALEDSTFAYYSDSLQASGYSMNLDHVFGIKGDSIDKFLVSIGYQSPSGYMDSTAQLVYFWANDSSHAVYYFNASITQDATLEYKDESVAYSKNYTPRNLPPGGLPQWLREYLACVGTGCAAAAIGCIGSNCGYLACLGLWCAGAAVGCGVAEIIRNL